MSSEICFDDRTLVVLTAALLYSAEGCWDRDAKRRCIEDAKALLAVMDSDARDDPRG